MLTRLYNKPASFKAVKSDNFHSHGLAQILSQFTAKILSVFLKTTIFTITKQARKQTTYVLIRLC